MKLQKRDLPQTAATQISGRQRSMHPRAFRSLFGAVAGALMLTAAFAPKANADLFVPELLVYYNFNQANATFPTTPYFSVGPPFGQANVPLFNNSPATDGFSGGNLQFLTTGGTTVNQATGDLSGAGGVLDARGNVVGSQSCFTIGPFNASSSVNINISFALMSTGSGGFDTLQLAYSTTGLPGSFINFNADGSTGGSTPTFTGLRTLSSFTTLSAFLPQAANFQSQLFIEFCFAGTKNNDTHNNTFIDNIQITGLAQIPESSTATGGLLSVVALCWHQRRRLIRSLGLRRT